MSNQKSSPPASSAPPSSRLETSFSGRTNQPGDLVVGKVVKITGSIAFVDYGARSEGYIELSELRDEQGELTVTEGDQVEAEIVDTRGGVRLSCKRAQTAKVLEELEQAYKTGAPVEGKVVGVNKGGFEVRVRGVRAFCPNSQFAERFVREPIRQVGRSFQFRITEFVDDGKSLVVSRRAILEEQKEKAREDLGDRVRVGDVRQGKVTRLADFGAFVDIGEGIEGLIHVSEISHEHVKHPKEKLSEGDAIEVKVIRVDPARGRLALSMKALAEDPKKSFFDDIEKGQKLTGTVARLTDFGAFVNIAPGVDGLLHISGISAERRIEHPQEVLSVGDEIEVVVEKVEKDRERVGLVTPEVHEARKPVDIPVKRGDTVKGPVTKVERFGVFVQIAPKVDGLVPNAEMDTDRGADHFKMFPPGTEIEALVTDVDRKRGRIRLSRKKLKEVAEQKALKQFRDKQQAEQGNSMGTFGDLLRDFLDKE